MLPLGARPFLRLSPLSTHHPTTAVFTPCSSALRGLGRKRVHLSSPSSFQFSSAASASVRMSTVTTPTVEHVVLFKVKPDTDLSKIDAMVSALRSLVSLPPVSHLTVGSVYRNRSSSFKFTHLLHSRYKSKEDLASYSSHPEHLDVVRSSVLPICDDIVAFDRISDLEGSVVPRSNSAMRLTLLKLKESTSHEEKSRVLSALGEIKAVLPEIEQISFGENFSPARAKGFSVGSITVLPGVKELDLLDQKGEMMETHKAKVRDILEDVIVVDYVISSPPPANL